MCLSNEKCTSLYKSNMLLDVFFEAHAVILNDSTLFLHY